MISMFTDLGDRNMPAPWLLLEDETQAGLLSGEQTVHPQEQLMRPYLLLNMPREDRPLDTEAELLCFNISSAKAAPRVVLREQTERRWFLPQEDSLCPEDQSNMAGAQTSEAGILFVPKMNERRV